MADDKVNVYHPLVRKTVAIDRAELDQAMADGWILETPGLAEARFYRDTQGDKPVQTALEGAASVLTLGGYDAVQAGVGAADERRARKELNPTADVVGQVAGAVLPTGRLGAVGKVLPGARAIESGIITERAAQRALSAFGVEGAGARAAAAGVGAATEGAIFGVGETVSDVALSEDPMNGEAIYATLKSNVLLGAKTGAVFGAGLSAVGDGARSILAKRATRAEAGVEADTAVDELIDLIDNGPGDLATDRKALQATAEGLEGRIGKLEDDLVGPAPNMKDVLPRVRDELAKVDNQSRQARATAEDILKGVRDPQEYGYGVRAAPEKDWKNAEDKIVRGGNLPVTPGVKRIRGADGRLHPVATDTDRLMLPRRDGQPVSEPSDYSLYNQPEGFVGPDRGTQIGVPPAPARVFDTAIPSRGVPDGGTQPFGARARSGDTLVERAVPPPPGRAAAGTIDAADGTRPMRARKPDAPAEAVDDAAEVAYEDILTVQADPRAVKVALDAFNDARREWEEIFKPDYKEVAGPRGGKPKRSYFSKATDEELLAAFQSQRGRIAHQAYRNAYVDLASALNPSKPFEDLFSNAGADIAVLGVRRAEIERLARIADTPPAAELAALKTQFESIQKALAASPENVKVAAAKRLVEVAERAGLKATPEDIVALARGRGFDIEGVPAGSDAEILWKAKIYERAAEQMRDVRKAADAAGDGERLTVKRGILASLGAAATAAAADWLFDNTFGTILGGYLGSKFALRFARRARRHFGPQNRRVAKKAEILAQRKTLTDRVLAGVDRFTRKNERGARAGVSATTALMRAVYSPDREKKPKSAHEAAKLVSREVRAANADPMRTSTLVFDRLEDVRDVDLKLYDQVDQHVRNVVAFLASKAPAEASTSPFRKTDTWTISDTEIDRFARYVEAAENPGVLVDRLGDGSLTSETVEAVKTLYPAYFNSVRSTLLARIDDLRRELPYRKRLLLGILFEMPADESLEPDRVALIQSMYGEASDQAASGGLAKDEIGSLKLRDETQPTPAQQLTG